MHWNYQDRHVLEPSGLVLFCSFRFSFFWLSLSNCLVVALHFSVWVSKWKIHTFLIGSANEKFIQFLLRDIFVAERGVYGDEQYSPKDSCHQEKNKCCAFTCQFNYTYFLKWNYILWYWHLQESLKNISVRSSGDCWEICTLYLSNRALSTLGMWVSFCFIGLLGVYIFIYIYIFAFNFFSDVTNFGFLVALVCSWNCRSHNAYY